MQATSTIRVTCAKPALRSSKLTTPAVLRAPVAKTRAARVSAQTIFMAGTALQFIKGVDEETVPEVKLTRSRTGSNGTANFIFREPEVFEMEGTTGEITGLFMIDEEGELSTVDVSAKFINGKPDRIEAQYVMKTSFEWDRFMRFMERYAEDNALGFNKK
mmetsp:Transcript_22748/g.31710  ORF Transcript_22748/g.31710 Transcript_22748/m.31710 type:complete len:160 (+) Transcript_22748:62-541(+)|eukprot:CAMPEP_0196579222 /NCGR_PEP_ID=MMETSP1081-20130531/19340_1 /TAXON_ID=36882 /ORGANISM="Pyramimonas amylifera, Strain CCMP720" /LENGTH=159 /DNA_ID=CAMNT_0041898731 /DNA_START=62 /DNA_END=541 /DNA_ORIENTATION=+